MNLIETRPVLRFLILATGLYILWYVVYDLWLHPTGQLDSIVVENSIVLAKSVLARLGYSVFTDTRMIGVAGAGGVWIGDPCNGVQLFALFAGFIIAFPGLGIHKLWFIPAGILSIHLLNVMRICALILIQKHAPGSLNFNHTYTFTFFMYAFIFGTWMLWVKKALPEKGDHSKEHS